MPPRSNSDFLDDTAEPDATADAPVPPRERNRPTEASEADELDQGHEVGYDDQDAY